MATPAVGKDIDSFCTKCDMVLNHVIVAKVGETVKRVKCLTCNTEHAYKSATKAAAAPKKKRAVGVRAGKVVATDYDTLMRGRDLSRAKKYKPADRFAKSDVLNHTQFGIGIVLGEKDGSKIEVAFADGQKTLVHGVV